MPQSLAQIYVHIVFSTKDRRRFLKDAKIRGAMHGYLVGICEKQGSPSIATGGVEDHVHIACRLSKTCDVASLIMELKKGSSTWIKTQFPGLEAFHWQHGYGAFSVSPSHLEALQVYIANQEEHHRRESFQDEFRRLLKTYGIEFDERYVWD